MFVPLRSAELTVWQLQTGDFANCKFGTPDNVVKSSNNAQQTTHNSRHTKMKILFLCSQNKLRSPTAESVFSEEPGLEVASAGLDKGAKTLVSPERIEWADIIFVMEKSQRNKLLKKYKEHINRQRVICLDIPDVYRYMDPELVKQLKAKVFGYLRSK
jgi:predicted protein tyrosine phosphatase